MTRTGCFVGIAVAGMLACFLASATAAGPAGPHVLDCRNVSEPVSYRAVFTARKSGGWPAFPGHAFVVIGKYDEGKGVCEPVGLYGLYAKSTATGALSWVFGPVPGEVQETDADRRQELYTHQLDVKIDSAGFRAVTRAIDKFASAKKYELEQHDCVSLVVDVLESVNASAGRDCIVVPQRAEHELPSEYVGRLIEANEK